MTARARLAMGAAALAAGLAAIACGPRPPADHVGAPAVVAAAPAIGTGSDAAGPAPDAAGSAPPAAPLPPAATAADSSPPPGAAGDAAIPAAPSSLQEERARAFGYFLDSPRPFTMLEQGLAIAERLRQRYGIDTGNPEADRRAAALRFQSEVLDRIVFGEEEIQATARRLGYSLDPAQCRNACENVRRLAEFELRKAALEAFADGRETPGRIP